LFIKALALFGTHLITYLVRKNIDCLLVTGTIHPWCVRGPSWMAIPLAIRFSWSPSVPDRSRRPPGQPFEMNAKYATVIQLEG
jgi:hypothetical protein